VIKPREKVKGKRKKFEVFQALIKCRFLLPFTLFLLPCTSAVVPSRADLRSLPGVIDAPEKVPPPSPPPMSTPEQSKVYNILASLNQIPEEQLSDKAGPSVPLLGQLRSEDGPEYLVLKGLVGRADVRKALNPSVKFFVAGLLAPRWDTYTIAGNLYLAAIQSPNPDVRSAARQKLIGFIQPSHIPVLIKILNNPGPNVLAFEVLQEITGQPLDPSAKAWANWWAKTHGKFDLVGHILSQSQMQLAQAQVHSFDQSVFWYLPSGVSRANVPLLGRSTSEQNAISQWDDWINVDVKRYVREWETAKPMFDRIVHQPDPRVAAYLISLVKDPGFGDYASIILAWRRHTGAIKAIEDANQDRPTVGRALALGSLGEKESLQDLLKIIESHKSPLAYGIMDDETRALAARLPTYGVVPAEQGFELLTHQRFGLASANTASEKKRALKKAERWLEENLPALTLDRSRGYFVTPSSK
jgi:hypothetical protein